MRRREGAGPPRPALIPCSWADVPEAEALLDERRRGPMSCHLGVAQLKIISVVGTGLPWARKARFRVTWQQPPAAGAIDQCEKTQPRMSRSRKSSAIEAHR